MSIGLDLGSHQFRSLRSSGAELVARCCPAVFIVLSDTVAHRRLLQQSNTQFATCSEQLLVIGDPAIEWSSMLNLSLSPLLRGGRIPTSDPVSRQLLSLMIDAVLPRPDLPGTVCCMTVPGGGLDERTNHQDAEFFQQVVALRGYRPSVVTATHALALAELNESSFTGIAISLGHSTCEFGIVHCGREIARCVLQNGLESFDGAPRLGDRHITQDPSAAMANLEREYARFFADAIGEARTRFELDRTLKTLPQPLTVVCTGGITTTPSFHPLFQRAWDESDWPVSTRPIRVCTDGSLVVVRGCLIQSELEPPPQAVGPRRTLPSPGAPGMGSELDSRSRVAGAAG